MRKEWHQERSVEDDVEGEAVHRALALAGVLSLYFKHWQVAPRCKVMPALKSTSKIKPK